MKIKKMIKCGWTFFPFSFSFLFIYFFWAVELKTITNEHQQHHLRFRFLIDAPPSTAIASVTAASFCRFNFTTVSANNLVSSSVFPSGTSTT
ncbi:hypothetical protein Hanom_Chr16g01440091 [Helianthus anomalus]